MNDTIISAAERRCLELAWRSCRAGTIGVGAIIVNAAGEIAVEGNNAIFAAPDAGPLSNSRIAHAEMNVLAQVGADVSLDDATLFTSLEPCAMCAGAILMHDLAAVHVLARDPLMHGLEAMGDRNDWVRERWLERSFATDPEVVRFATLFAMHAAFFWFDDAHPLVAAVTVDDPETASWIRSVAKSGRLTELADAGAELDDVVEALR